MAYEDRSSNATGDVHGVVFQAHNVYLDRTPPMTRPSSSEPPENWASAGELPAEVRHLLWAEEQAAKALPYQLRGARRPSLGTVYVRQDLSSGVEDGPADQLRTTPVLDEYGRLVEVPGVASVRVAVRPPSKPLRAALDGQDHLVVVGGPGQGKSTLTLRLAADVASHWSARAGEPPIAEPVIPLRITASLLAAHLGPSFAKALADSACAEYGPYLNEPVDPAWLSGRVAGCRWLLLVDALDEVADTEQRAKLVDTLAGWACSPVYRIVLTTRPTERGALAALQREGAARYELQPFDEESLERFAHNWFEDEDLTHRFLQQIREAHLYELVEVPLLATIAAIVFEQYGQRPLPGNQFELYESYLAYIGSSRSVPETFERHRMALVEHLGRTRLAADLSLVDAVEEWARQQETSADELIEHLKAVGPFTQRGSDLAFLHHSFAEHVAATAEARDLPVPFASERAAFARLLHAATPLEEGRFARAVLLHYTYLHRAEADRLLAWLHQGGSEQHLLAARLLGRHLPASSPVIDEFLVTVRRWAMTTRYRGGSILRYTTRATHHSGLVQWLIELMGDATAPWKSRAEAATALGVRVRGAHTAEATAFLRSTVDDPAGRVEHRLFAAEALAQTGSGQREAAVRGLRSVLADPLASGADCRNAAVVLSAFGARERATAVTRLSGWLSDADSNPVDVVEAATGLVEIEAEFHGRCAEAFRAVLADSVHSMDGRRAAAIGLASLGKREEAAEALTRLVLDQRLRSADRATAASALAALGPEHRANAGELLLAQLDAPISDINHRSAFAPVLARIGHRERAVEMLLAMLSDRTSSWSDVLRAASSLDGLGPSFRDKAAHYLETAVTHLPPAQWEHVVALRWLVRLGEPYRGKAVARMRRLLSDLSIDPRDRCTIADEVADCAPELTGEMKDRLLAMATTDLDPRAQAGAWAVLRLFGAETQEQAGHELLKLARLDPIAPVDVGKVFGTAAAAGRAAAAEVLLGVARDEECDLDIRLSAAEGLTNLGVSYVRAGAGRVCAFIAADMISDFVSAVRPFVRSGRGIRQLLVTELTAVLDRGEFDAARSWSVSEAMDLLGFEVPASVLRSVVDDHFVDRKTRACAAIALARMEPARRESAADLVFLAAPSMWSPGWRRLVIELACMGVDVHRRLRGLLANPNTFRAGTSAAAWLLGVEGAEVLRAQAADPHMPFDNGAHLRQLLVRVDSEAFPEAIAYHRQAMVDPALPIATRCDAAKRLAQLDRTYFAESSDTLFALAEDPHLTPDENALAAIALTKHYDLVCPPRLVRIIAGLAGDPETFDARRHELVAALPVRHRKAFEPVMLADHSASIGQRMPESCALRGLALRSKAEQVVRDVLDAPEIGVRERRRAAIELATISPRHIPEAIGMLLSDASPDAQAKAAGLGVCQKIVDGARKTVLDQRCELRQRRAAALLIGRLTATPFVHQFLLADKTAPWRDRIDQLWYADAEGELRSIRDDPATPAAQRRRAASLLDDYTVEDRAAAVRTLTGIAEDPRARPALRWRAAKELAGYGVRGCAEAARLLQLIACDDTLPVTARAEAAFQVGRIVPTRRAEMLDALRGFLSTPNPLHRRYVLEAITTWSPWEGIEELYRMTADERLGPVVRLHCAMEIVSTRRDQRDRCSVVAREIAFDAEVPRHVRRRAARYLAEWSDVCRQEARELLVRLRDCGGR